MRQKEDIPFRKAHEGLYYLEKEESSQKFMRALYKAVKENLEKMEKEYRRVLSDDTRLR